MNDKKQDKKKSIIFNIIVLILIAILGFFTVFFYKVEEKNYTNSEIDLNFDNLNKMQNSTYSQGMPLIASNFVNYDFSSLEDVMGLSF